MTNCKYKLCNGQAKQLLDHFKSTTFFEEKQVDLSGFISNIQNFYFPQMNYDKYLLMYINANIEKYNKYWQQQYGQINVPNDKYYILQYINKNNLNDDFRKFTESNPIINDKTNFENIESYINEKITPLLEQSRNIYIFIYRDIDNKGLLITKYSDENNNIINLINLLNNLLSKLYYCKLNYNNSSDKRQLFDMVRKIINFKEIYFLNDYNYNLLINILNNLKNDLTQKFIPDNHIEALNNIMSNLL